MVLVFTRRGAPTQISLKCLSAVAPAVGRADRLSIRGMGRVRQAIAGECPLGSSMVVHPPAGGEAVPGAGRGSLPDVDMPADNLSRSCCLGARDSSRVKREAGARPALPPQL
jgi:hypothetical protein